MSNITYRRGQAEWALWQVFRLGSGARETMPPAFSARIKKLLDLDRDQSGVKLAIAGRAFSDADKRRSGRDAELTALMCSVWSWRSIYWMPGSSRSTLSTLSAVLATTRAIRAARTLRPRG